MRASQSKDLNTMQRILLGPGPCIVPIEGRLTSLTTPRFKVKMDDVRLHGRLLDESNIEIAGGFGQLLGKVWHIGLLGYSSRPENVLLLL